MIQATDFYSRGAIVLQYAVGIAAAVTLRLLLSRLVEGGLRRGIILSRKVIMIGRKEILNDVQASLKRDGVGTDVVDVIALDPNDAHRKRIALQRVKAIARHMPVEDIVIALPWQDHAHIREFVEGLSTIPATVHLAPDQSWVWIRDLSHQPGRARTHPAACPCTADAEGPLPQACIRYRNGRQLAPVVGASSGVDRGLHQTGLGRTGFIPAASKRVQPARVSRL